ncbi:MAG: hypothetical protein A2X49_00865 [Lentisphaerae bacterium GWF2_52_8]|nr:MAG: hypothetical protein A2X49_00865 [Lentisphaerae bacterium GWF2_52_8]
MLNVFCFGLCIGTAFLLSQIVLSLVFKSSFAVGQWIAILLITVGILLFCMTSPERDGKGASVNETCR